ncbi:hypothetical protein [Pedococcus dokdonensis]|nr:hypothetical protein [Pedococcus dokdonensis]
MEIVVTVDCPSTSRRFVSRLGVDEYLASSDASIDVDVPAGAVALELKMTCHVVLKGSRAAHGHTATLSGSRLAESPTTRLVLEGDASRFPTEALSFNDLRWEPAAWSVRIDVDDMNDAFRGAVRLVLNTDHPVGAGLAAADPKTYGALGSVVRIDIVRAILLVAFERVVGREGGASGFDDESFGSVARQMANDHFGMSLEAVGEMKVADAARFERVLQSSMGMEVTLS